VAHCQKRIEIAVDEWGLGRGPLIVKGAEIADIRQALQWAFTTTGDAAMGMALLTASAPMWLEMSLLDEFRGWAMRALDCVAAPLASPKQHRAQLSAICSV
jgi:predicted ATPase